MSFGSGIAIAFAIVYAAIAVRWFVVNMSWVFRTQNVRSLTWQDRFPLIVEAAIVGIVLTLPLFADLAFYIIFLH